MIPLLQGLQVFVLKARTVFFDGRIPLNRDGSSRVRKTPIAAGRLLWAGIATLAQPAGHLARQEDRDDGTVDSPLPEPDPRQFSRAVDLWAAHIRQATRWASLDDLHQALSHFLLGNGLEQQVRRHQRHQGEPGQQVQQEIDAVMKLGRPEDGPGQTAVLNQVFAGELGFSAGPRDYINAHNRNEDHMRDTRLAGSVQQAARAFDIDLPGPFAGEMDHHIHALDGLGQARAGLQISLLPLRARPILSRVGPSTHPTHGIAGLTQVLHHQAAQSSRAAGHQNMLHVTILSCFSVLCMPLSEARTGDKRARADVTLLWLSLSCYGLTIREKEKGEQWTNPGERGTREKRSSTIACCSFPLPIG